MVRGLDGLWIVSGDGETVLTLLTPGGYTSETTRRFALSGTPKSALYMVPDGDQREVLFWTEEHFVLDAETQRADLCDDDVGEQRALRRDAGRDGGGVR